MTVCVVSREESHDPMVEAACDGELALLHPTVRRDADQLRALLADDFREIGASGRLFDRDAIIAALVAETAPESAPDPSVSDLTGARVSDELVLLTYRLEFAGRITRRSSLWRVSGGRAELLFHQGTPAQ